MSTPNLNIIFTPQAAHHTSAPVDTQQYVIDWQNLLLDLNGVFNLIASSFIPVFPPGANGVVYVVGGVANVLSGTGIVYENASASALLTGTGLVYENASLPGILVGSGTVFVASGVPSVLGGTGLYYQSSSSPTLLPGNGIVYISGGIPAALPGTGVVYQVSNVPQLGGFGTAAQILTSTGASTVPVFDPIRVALGLSASATGVLIITSGVTGATAGTEIVRADGSLVNGDGVLVVTGGGTGYTSLSGATEGAVVAQGTSVDNFQVSTSGAVGNVLTSRGTGTPPTFGTVSSALGFSSSTGTMQENGGTIIVSTGSVGQVLTANGAGVLPSYQNPASSQTITSQSILTPGVNRLTNTTYNNGNGKALFVSVSILIAGAGGPTTINAVTDSGSPPTTVVAQIANEANTVPSIISELTFWVLAGNNYRVNATSGSLSVEFWTEWL